MLCKISINSKQLAHDMVILRYWRIYQLQTGSKNIDRKQKQSKYCLKFKGAHFPSGKLTTNQSATVNDQHYRKRKKTSWFNYGMKKARVNHRNNFLGLSLQAKL